MKINARCPECDRLRAIHEAAADRYFDFYERTTLLTEEAQEQATPLWSEWIAAGRALDNHERNHKRKQHVQ